MKPNKGSLSTPSGALLILGFFVLLFCLPFLIESKKVTFNSAKSDAGQTSPLTFPLELKLSIYRDSSPQNRFKNTRVTLGEILKENRSPVLINFWATWCPPCLEELPSVELLNKQLKNKLNAGSSDMIRLITISVDDRMDDIAKLEATLDFKPSFLVLFDKEGELARSMGTTKFPETYLVSAQGKILYKWLGPQDWLSFDVLQQIKRQSK